MLSKGWIHFYIQTYTPKKEQKGKGKQKAGKGGKVGRYCSILELVSLPSVFRIMSMDLLFTTPFYRTFYGRKDRNDSQLFIRQ